MRNLSRKKLIYFSTIAILIIILCIGIIINQYNRKRININKFSQFMLSSSIYGSDMKELDIANIHEHYRGVNASDILEGKVFVSTDGTAREFSIIEANGAQSTDDIQKAFEIYCSELLKKYQLESTEEYERMKGYSIQRTRNYIILTISDRIGNGYKISDFYLDKTKYDRRN
ncbi:DUF4358 domain-containing protein [Clostridium swellfunianum]|uniref:DUF4358 domain-containing protein n=1 Tax=Clostridium swellfunianum TaxID=1367462 RepID=UPI0020309D60|nr:DUF4358 domain-containing protein [Clostridium swellfunianum]MCM0648143.1 DUF4358 domain-containing protein [Clostridium swellfunianum]